MTRWEPHAGERLRVAALDIFAERGFDAVTVSDIAERAGMTRRSFFRHFPDKREVLFAGSEVLAGEVERRLNEISPRRLGMEHVLDVFAVAGTILLQDRDAQRRRRAIIASSPELLERDRTKIADLATAVSRSLERNGRSAAEAGLLGSLCAETFRSAFDRALTDDAAGDFARLLGDAEIELRSFLSSAPSTPGLE